MNSEVKVPFVDLGRQFVRFQDEIVKSFIDISSRGAYVLTPEVKEFEDKFAELCGTRFAVGMANGTDTMVLTMRAWGIGPGDEVITAPNSFIASSGAIFACGAKPVFVDVGDDYNLDPEKLEAAIHSKTKAIMPVHLTGMPADMDPINTLAKKYGLKVIEDAAQAVGAIYKEKKVGSLGDAGSFSLHPLKNLHVQGDGGVLTTDDEALYNKLIQLRNHGLRNRNESDFWAYNSRLDSIQAAIGTIKLKYMDKITERFREIAKMYLEGLKGLAEVELPIEPEGRMGVYHNFVLQTDQRDKLQAHLLNCGVDTKIHYPILLHRQKTGTELGYKEGDFPVAEKQVQRILSLPIYPELTDDEVNHVIKSIRQFSF